MKNSIILVIIGIIAIAAITFAYNQNKNNDVMENKDKMMEDDSVMKNDDEAMMENDEMMMDDDKMSDDSMMKDEDKMMDGEDSAMMHKGSYETYDSAKLALANEGDVVLFFHAPWCPTCKALNTDIEASLEDIPSGLTILKTDYDSETELKQKYGITYQHTFVQVDANGNMIKKWSGSATLEDLVSQVN